MNTATRVPPSTKEILKRQAEDAARQRAEIAQKRVKATPPASETGIVPARPDVVAVPRTPQQQYLDMIAPATIVGRLIKFSKDSTFMTNDDGEPIGESTDFVALCDQTLIGWVRFHEDGQPPDRVMGLLYDGFVMPERDTLGDTDRTTWKIGLNGEPESPWQHHCCLVLQKANTDELFTFVASAPTRHRAVGNLLRHFDRMRRTHSGELPVVRLKVGGYQHSDTRVGWVATPVFAVVGRAPRDSVAKPDTSVQGQLNDHIPF